MRVETITPQVAKALLEKNTNNRNITKGHLAFLKSEMLSGNWQFNGQGIIVGASGRLLDGQHRLTAVVETGVSIDSLVLRGIDEAAFVTIDTGKHRGGADVLSIAGSKHGAHIASAIRKVIEQFGGSKKVQGRYSHRVGNTEYFEYFQKHTVELEDMFDMTHSWVLEGTRILSESDAMAFIILMRDENDSVYNFLEEVITGRIIKKDSNAGAVCRKKLLDTKIAGNQVREFQKKDWILYCFRKYNKEINFKNILIKEPQYFIKPKKSFFQKKVA
jgi:hypothetical protein